MRPFDASGAFHPVGEGGELRRLAVRGAGVTVFSSGLALAVQIVATIVLARLLAPSDFGLVAMVTTFSLLLVNFGLNGFTEAVLQREEMDHALASNLFWINLGAGLLLTLGFAAAGSLLARFYGDPRVAHVAIGVSATILISSTSVLHSALLKRAMRFTAVSIVAIVASAVSVVASIFLAWAGWGYWALVAGLVAQQLTVSIGAWMMCRWIPRLTLHAAGTASMVGFALHVYGRFTFNYFARNVDNLLVGWRFGAVSLGFYKKAYDLFALSATQLVSPLANVAVSALSRLNRDSIQYRRYLLRAISVMAFVGMGLSADFTLVGKDLIRLLLGPGWEQAGRIFTFFGPGIGVMLIYYVHGWIHLSIGKADRWLRWGFVEVSVTFLLFVVALPWGPAGIAVAWTSSFWILTIPAFWYAGKPISFGVGPVLATIWRYVAASMLAGCACAGIMRSLMPFAGMSGAGEALARIVTISLLFGSLYLGAVILLHGGAAPLYQIAALLREMVPSGRFSKPSRVVAASAATSEALP